MKQLLSIWLRRLLHMLTFLSGEGSWSLRPVEAQLIKAALDHIDEADGKLLASQLSESFFVERINPRIVVLRFYKIGSDQVVCSPDFEDKLIRVHFVADGKRQVSNVCVFEGVIFSVEMKDPRLLRKAKQLTVEKVVAGTPKQSLTRVIDRSEHGSG
ncbi:MAG: hypothetical protein AAGA50_10830 [Pseudomonadota bacterium]